MGNDTHTCKNKIILPLLSFLLRKLPIKNGKGRIIDKTFLGSIRFDKETLQTSTIYGADITVFPNDLVGRHIFFTGTFDQSVFECLCAFAGDNPVLWDIGANIGYMSVEFLHRFPVAHVVAFEPLPDIFHLLRNNIVTPYPERATAVNAAVSNHQGSAHIQRMEHNSGGSHISDKGGDEIALVTGNMMLNTAPAPTVIKIDVEGHEAQALAGLSDVLANNSLRAVVFEHHTTGLVSQDVSEPLVQAGFKIFRIWKNISCWGLHDANSAYNKNNFYPTADYAAIRGTIPDNVKILS